MEVRSLALSVTHSYVFFVLLEYGDLPTVMSVDQGQNVRFLVNGTGNLIFIEILS